MLDYKKTGQESIGFENQCPIAKLEDFWQWAYSDIMGNAQRGIFAEFLVACALGEIKEQVRISWDKYDLLLDNKIKIEVKSSGYLQTWRQSKLSEIKFSIAKTRGWNYLDNTFENEKKRQADIYVFCIFKHTDRKSANPLNIAQWDFYLLSTKKLNDVLGSQKTIGLNKLQSLGAVKIAYSKLKEEIYREYRKYND